MIYTANEAALAFFQAQAGYTRLGAHAGRVNGWETGEWREADLAVASFGRDVAVFLNASQ